MTDIEFEMKLNVGCGLDVREGWVNLDIDAPEDDPNVIRGDARELGRWLRQADVILVNHVLHMLTVPDARVVLEGCWQALKRGGELVIVEADVLGVIEEWLDPVGNVEPSPQEWLLDLVADKVEPTAEGKLLRWVSWHGTRRSLWSAVSLGAELERLGFSYWEVPQDEEEWSGDRHLESFVVRAVR